MATAVTVALLFLASLGLSLIVCSQVFYRLRHGSIEDRVTRASVPGVSGSISRKGVDLAKRLDVQAERVLALLVTTEVWPREVSAARILSHGIWGSVILTLFLHFAISLSWWKILPCSLAALAVVPIISARSEQQRLKAKFEGMLADTIDMMVRMLRAGLPVTAAVARVGREAQEPAAAVYREAAEWLSMGMPLAQAMRTVADRIRVRDFDFFSSALALQSTVGGNLTQTLDSLAAVIRERTVSVLKAKAVTAQARTTANVILGIIPFLAVMMQLARPDYLAPLVDGSHGYGLLSFVIFSYIVAFVVIRQLIGRVRVR